MRIKVLGDAAVMRDGVNLDFLQAFGNVTTYDLPLAELVGNIGF